MRESFTLIELLVVIAILAVLATAVVLVLNPSQLLAQGRDSTRLSDLSALNSALSLFQTDQWNQPLGNASTTYVSIPDSSSTCGNLGLPALPGGYSYACVPAASSTRTDGSGWIPVNLTLISSGSPLSKLPIDPVNTTSSGLYYTYTPGGSFELTAIPESQKYKAQIETNPMIQMIPGVIAYGSNLNLSPLFNASGLVGYWPLDGNASDMSGNGNNGTLVNSPMWTSGCKVGGCLSFNGTSSNASVNLSAALNSLITTSNQVSFSAWVRPNSQISTQVVGWGYMNGVWIDGNGQIVGEINVNSTREDATPRYVIPSYGTWYYAAGTGDAISGVTKLYINGVMVSSKTYVPGSITSISGNPVIGAGNGYFNGLIDDVRIYNRPLSAAEIQAMYNAEK